MYAHMMLELGCTASDKVETETAVTRHKGHQLVCSAKHMVDVIVQECLQHEVASLNEMAQRYFVVNNITRFAHKRRHEHTLNVHDTLNQIAGSESNMLQRRQMQLRRPQDSRRIMYEQILSTASSGNPNKLNAQ